MKPKIFVSSTYYDMKYIRENVEKMLDSLGFDSILFESGDVTFEHDKPMDISCYKEVGNANMMMLIVGGRYGSESTTMEVNEYANKYDKYYVSVTKKEFLTARDKGIPIYIFVDNSVLIEYETYKKNKELYYLLDENKVNVLAKKIEFAYVDSVNIFEFIGEIYAHGFPIYKFIRYEDIENQFRTQISGLLYLYLESLIDNKKTEVVSKSVDSMKNLIERMEKMVQKVGEKVLEDDQDILSGVKIEQKKLLNNYYVMQMGKRVSTSGGEFEERIWNIIADYIIDKYLMSEKLRKAMTYEAAISDSNMFNEFQDTFIKELKRLMNQFKMNLDRIQIQQLEKDFSNVFSFADESPDNLSEVKKMFAIALSQNCVPF